jgi:ankyrin repeat protein
MDSVFNSNNLTLKQCFMEKTGWLLTCKQESELLEQIYFSSDLNMIKYLVEKGLNKRTQYQILLGAIATCHIDIIEFIVIKGGVNINSHDIKNGMTLLHYSCLTPNIDVITVLLQLGADPKLKTYDGKTASDIAIKDEIIALIDNYSIPDIKNPEVN